MANPNLTGAPRDKNFVPVITTYNNVASGRKTVTTAGTAVPLLSVQTEAKRLDVTALETNTDFVTIGGSGVIGAKATRQGIPIAATNTYTFFITDVSQVYVDSVVNGEGVTFNYFW